ncbi:MAG: aminotransferase class V-fold PLP-dependent enzyme [Gammaproteobacteria bacterium]
MTKLETLAVHAGRETDPHTGAVVPPLHLSTTYARDAEGGITGRYQYTRYANPNRVALETCIAELEGGAGAAAFGSGMAAAHAVFQALKPGDRVVVSQDAYHGVHRLLDEVMAPWGLSVAYADFSDGDALVAALKPGAALVWAETPSNPLLKLCDLGEVASLAHAAGAIAVCDNTFATPILQRPFEHGFDLVMHSATKFFGGHSDVLGGALVVREDDDLFARIRTVQARGGAVPAPFDCYLILRGLATLALRIRAQSANALALAEWLAEHPRIARVHYPFLASHPQHALARRQMAAGGGILSFELDASPAVALRTATRTRLFQHATSLGGVESLIEHRASTEGPTTRTPATLLRLAVGIEHPDDLRDDLAQALEHA